MGNGEGAVRPGCNKAAKEIEVSSTENIVIQTAGIPFLCMYTDTRESLRNLDLLWVCKGLRTLSTYAQYQTTNTALETRVYTKGYLFSSYGAQKTTHTTMSAIITCWLS